MPARLADGLEHGSVPRFRSISPKKWFPVPQTVTAASAHKLSRGEYTPVDIDLQASINRRREHSVAVRGRLPPAAGSPALPAPYRPRQTGYSGPDTRSGCPRSIQNKRAVSCPSCPAGQAAKPRSRSARRAAASAGSCSLRHRCR